MPAADSIDVGADGKSAIFFGLSGTGKTTLSADPSRTLIGDDEHGWSDQSVFNFEGGCYAKMINLSAEGEPEIYATTKMFGTILENVTMDEETRELDFTDASKTENTRGAYSMVRHPLYLANFTLTGGATLTQSRLSVWTDESGLPQATIDAMVTGSNKIQMHGMIGPSCSIADVKGGKAEKPASRSSPPRP